MKFGNSNLLKIISPVVLTGMILFFSGLQVRAQEIVDKTVATLSDGVSTTELITYSDLLWQLALQPDTPINPPNSDDLNAVLQLLIEQRLFALEAKRLPRNAPTEAEVKKEIERVVALFPPGEFERRLRSVGFASINDENFRRIMEQRVAIEKYLDFRFRSFVIITQEDEMKYYRETYTPEFRRRNPGVIVPPLVDVRARINQILVERKVTEDMERFLDDAKRRAQINVLFEV